MWEIIKAFNVEQELFCSLWQLHNLMHGWMFVRMLPTASVKMVDASQLN